MVDTKSPGDKTLSVPTKTLTLKPRVETGTVPRCRRRTRN
jgi:translation initiation factor IF-2